MVPTKLPETQYIPWVDPSLPPLGTNSSHQQLHLRLSSSSPALLPVFPTSLGLEVSGQKGVRTHVLFTVSPMASHLTLDGSLY